MEKEEHKDTEKKEEENKKKKKRKSIFPILIIIILILLSIYPILNSMKGYVTVKRTELVDEPVEIIKEVEVHQPIKEEFCKDTNYYYLTISDPVQSDENYVWPTLVIINREEKYGLYKVNFSYIDNSKFPESIYGGENLYAHFEAGNITFDDAEFKSITYEFPLGPGDEVLIRNKTRKPARDEKTYWAIADIREPTYYRCINQTVYVNKTMNKTFIDIQKVKRTVNVKEYRPLSELLPVKTFGEWFVIVFMFILILVLILKIREERRINREIREEEREKED